MHNIKSTGYLEWKNIYKEREREKINFYCLHVILVTIQKEEEEEENFVIQLIKINLRELWVIWLALHEIRLFENEKKIYVCIYWFENIEKKKRKYKL